MLPFTTQITAMVILQGIFLNETDRKEIFNAIENDIASYLGDNTYPNVSKLQDAVVYALKKKLLA